MINKKLSSSEKKVLNEKLKEKNRMSQIDKYNLYLLPNSTVCFDGVLCDFQEFKKLTINLIKNKFRLTFVVDVRFNGEDVEYFEVNNQSLYYNPKVTYKELIRSL